MVWYAVSTGDKCLVLHKITIQIYCLLNVLARFQFSRGALGFQQEKERKELAHALYPDVDASAERYAKNEGKR